MALKYSFWATAMLMGLVALAGLAPSAAAVPGDGMVFIGLVGEFFSPTGRTAENGDVTFISFSAAVHRPVADNGCFVAPAVASGESETVNLTPCGPSGTLVHYHCQIHPFAAATIMIA